MSLHITTFAWPYRGIALATEAVGQITLNAVKIGQVTIRRGASPDEEAETIAKGLRETTVRSCNPVAVALSSLTLVVVADVLPTDDLVVTFSPTRLTRQAPQGWKSALGQLFTTHEMLEALELKKETS